MQSATNQRGIAVAINRFLEYPLFSFELWAVNFKKFPSKINDQIYLDEDSQADSEYVKREIYLGSVRHRHQRESADW
jgi:hypothetical protein